MNSFPQSRAIDIQVLIGNAGGYIGLVLGYSLLQIPDFIIVIFTRTKRWLSQIENRRNQNHTKVWTVKLNDKELTSKGISQKETNEFCDTKGNDVHTDAKYAVMMKRIGQLERSMDSKFDEILKRME